MKALIIDDEIKARKLLTVLLEQHCPNVTIVGQAGDLEQGVALIRETKPDVVFLDIEMPRYSGLQITSFFTDQPIDFQIVFTTAYNQYAISAFKLSATDYLLKPIDVDELKNAVEKVTLAQKNDRMERRFDDLKKAFENLALNKIALEIPKGIIFVSHDDILFFEAEGMYTNVYMRDGSKELICKPLKHFVMQLATKTFFYKPHRSYLVNLKFIKELVKKNGYHLVMENKRSIPISKEKQEGFLHLVKDVF